MELVSFKGIKTAQTKKQITSLINQNVLSRDKEGKLKCGDIETRVPNEISGNRVDQIITEVAKKMMSGMYPYESICLSKDYNLTTDNSTGIRVEFFYWGASNLSAEENAKALVIVAQRSKEIRDAIAEEFRKETLKKRRA